MPVPAGACLSPWCLHPLAPVTHTLFLPPIPHSFPLPMLVPSGAYTPKACSPPFLLPCCQPTAISHPPATAYLPIVVPVPAAGHTPVRQEAYATSSLCLAYSSGCGDGSSSLSLGPRTRVKAIASASPARLEAACFPCSLPWDRVGPQLKP